MMVFDLLSLVSITVLVVLGLGVIVSLMGIFNFAQGEFLLLGAFVTYLFHVNGLPVWMGMIAAPILVALFGLAIERSMIRRTYRAPVTAMLVTYALSILLREIVRRLSGGLFVAVPAPFPGFVTVFDLHFPAWRAFVILVCILVLVASYLVLVRTNFGLSVRAAMENPSLARSSGISTERIYALTFAFGAGLAGLAGALVVPMFSLYADLGLRFLIQGFVSVLVGGMGSFLGPVLGSAVIGTASGALPWVVSPVAADLLIFAIAILFVKLRPGGLIGKGN